MYTVRDIGVCVSSLRSIHDEASIQLLNNKNALLISHILHQNQLKQSKKHKVLHKLDSL